MKSRPILYSAAMILAKLAGRKSQTRRLLNPQPGWEFHGQPFVKCPDMDELPQPILCPYGAPGDVLWSRENHRLMLVNPAKRIVGVRYEADGAEREVQLTPAEWKKLSARKWKVGHTFDRLTPGRFMYRSLSRFWDEIVSVRCERLQDISEADAIAEGCEAHDRPDLGPVFRDYLDASGGFYGDGAAKLSYQSLWCALHGHDSWEQNPFIRVITTKKWEGAAP